MALPNRDLLRAVGYFKNSSALATTAASMAPAVMAKPAFKNKRCIARYGWSALMWTPNLQLCNKAMAGNTRALNVCKKYIDFAASRDSSGGIRLEVIDDEPRPKQQGGENGSLMPAPVSRTRNSTSRSSVKAVETITCPQAPVNCRLGFSLS